MTWQEALLAMDDSSLTLEHLDALSRAIPDDTERRDIQAYLQVSCKSPDLHAQQAVMLAINMPQPQLCVSSTLTLLDPLPRPPFIGSLSRLNCSSLYTSHEHCFLPFPRLWATGACSGCRVLVTNDAAIWNLSPTRAAMLY